MIGQLGVLLEDDGSGEKLSAVRRTVRAALEGRSWASFHDRVSGPLPPRLDGVQRAGRRWSNDELLELAYDSGSAPPVVELVDHQTQGFFPEQLPHAYLHWELDPGVHHLIEAVAAVEPQSTASGGEPQHEHRSSK